ncbi:DUF4142 domain-containing protein [Stenotrophomonas sp. HITSZ_GD]|nr:DUF4142 domain-containing protein [Stenotrophomonas sp. HITSZ_GD]MDG2524121.1 DUF4142 domain-containing protein [Stenotrophomonas sp. HITSZ_GD]
MAQTDPNDPDEARTHYEAPVPERRGPAVLGWPQATARERAGLGLLSALDQYQADLSRLALDRGLDPDVQAWAERMLAAHASGKGRHDPWLPDLAQPRTQDLIRRGQRELTALRAADAQAVSSSYLRAMRTSLAQTLALLDHELIPAASTAAVRAHLHALRDPLAGELTVARRLRAHDDAHQEPRHEARSPHTAHPVGPEASQGKAQGRKAPGRSPGGNVPGQ